MFAHVSPEEDSFGETVSTLKFAQRVSTVELGAARLNRESRDVMQLKEQVDMFITKGFASTSVRHFGPNIAKLSRFFSVVFYISSRFGALTEPY